MTPIRYKNENYANYVPVKDRINLVNDAIKIFQSGVTDPKELSRRLNVSTDVGIELLMIAYQDKENQIDML